jgi:hypothetical protein
MDLPELQDIRNLSPDVLPHLYSTMIPEDRRSVSDAFWEEFNEKDKAIGYRACLLLWVQSKVEALGAGWCAAKRGS